MLKDLKLTYKTMKRSSVKQLLVFLISCLCLVDGMNSTNTVCLYPCSCRCAGRILNDTILASCKVKSIESLAKLILQPENITELDVSASQFYTIQPLSFARFSNLLTLNLSFNGITVIGEDAFRGLSALQTLDLSYNKIKYWDDGKISSQLSSLLEIDLSGNPLWTPFAELLQISSLSKMYGVTWNRHCTKCSLVKNMDKNKTELYKKGNYGDYVVWHCRGIEYEVAKETQKFAKYGFYPECFKTNKKCYESQIKGTKSHRCWASDNVILYLEYFIGIISIVFNVTVITVTLNSPLKNDVAMLLVSNLAFCDLLNGIYGISITIIRQASSYTVFLTYLNGLCSVLGFLWVLSQFGVIQTSLLLTLERYVTIIFSMKPHLKPTPAMAKSFICITWFIAVVAAVLPLVGPMGSYVTNTYCVPMQPSKEAPGSFMYSVVLALVGMILYFLTIPLYVKIFRYVRKSSQQMGIKRDAKIAGRILVLVITNMFFFLTPIIIALLWLVTNLFKRNISVQGRNVLVGVFPMLCLSFNSFLNPLLYAFRNSRFKQALSYRLNRFIVRQTAVADISMKTRSLGSKT